MADEAYLRKTTSRTKAYYVLSNFSCKTLSHLKKITFGMVFIRTRQQDDAIWVEKCNLISEKAHIPMVTLEPVTHHEKMDSNIATTAHFLGSVK